uniref:G protein-coupled receptor n=1 Tax=Steinernema glaseri TaxID=37863 RepID=A0A1I7YAY4_9BILA
MVVPDVLYELLPITGFALTASSLFVLVAMHNEKKGAFMFLYAFAVIDMISGIAMLYAGFFGVFMTTYGASKIIPPYKCITTAIHLTIWCWMDYANLGVLAMLCMDRLVSVIFGRIYDTVSKCYSHFLIVIIIFFSSALVFGPQWRFALQSYRNETVRVSPLCYFDEVLGDGFKFVHMEMRLWTPIGGVGFLAVVFLLYFICKSIRSCSYGWIEDEKQAQTLYMCIFMRCALTSLSVHLPMMAISSFSTQNDESRQAQDFLLRLSQAILVGILQPGVYLIVSPSFVSSARIIFNRYTYNTKRTWQSAQDPPEEKHDRDDPHFGSWYNTSGNIIGEAGIPFELDADVERSISFYCSDRARKIENNYM